jgi:hypothetical protein
MMTVTRPSRDGEFRTFPLIDYVFEHAQRWPDRSAVTDGATTATRIYREQTATARRAAAGLAGRGVTTVTPTGVTPFTWLLKRHPASTTNLDTDDVDIEVRRAGLVTKSQLLMFRIEPVNGIVVH